MSDRFQQLRLVEALLFASAEPLAAAQIKRHLPEDADLDDLLDELRGLYANRGVNLVRIGERWAFRTAADLAPAMQIEHRSVRKPSRAAVETLAIIAYHQPVTRAEIEEIRGVALSRGTLDTLLEAGWIKPKGRRRSPGRPVTWGTTDAFLDHFGLEGLDALPGVSELAAAGLLDTRPAITALGGRGQLLAQGEVGEDSEDLALGADGGEDRESDEGLDESEALAADFGEDLVEPDADEPNEEDPDEEDPDEAGPDDDGGEDGERQAIHSSDRGPEGEADEEPPSRSAEPESDDHQARSELEGEPAGPARAARAAD